MLDLQFSRAALNDLIEIDAYSAQTWGVKQAERYLHSLERCLTTLQESPSIGRRCDKVRAGYRRFEHERHTIFYKVDESTLFISRILHQGMSPKLHQIDGEL